LWYDHIMRNIEDIKLDSLGEIGSKLGGVLRGINPSALSAEDYKDYTDVLEDLEKDVEELHRLIEAKLCGYSDDLKYFSESQKDCDELNDLIYGLNKDIADSGRVFNNRAIQGKEAYANAVTETRLKSMALIDEHMMNCDICADKKFELVLQELN